MNALIHVLNMLTAGLRDLGNVRIWLEHGRAALRFLKDNHPQSRLCLEANRFVRDIQIGTSPESVLQSQVLGDDPKDFGGKGQRDPCWDNVSECVPQSDPVRVCRAIRTISSLDESGNPSSAVTSFLFSFPFTGTCGFSKRIVLSASPATRFIIGVAGLTHLRLVVTIAFPIVTRHVAQLRSLLT